MHELKPQSNSRQMIQKFWINKNSSLDIEPSRLKIKFHCGEEFLDLVDGMRAIDETILFLDMRKGDYLGHVLALGINVQEWYKRKPSTLFLPVQDILDNLVWFVGTARRFKIHSYPKEIKELESLILRYFNDIYREVPIHSILSPSELAQLLYQSWTLRGDNPFRYDRHRCLPDQPILTLWNKNDLNDSKRVEAWIRMNPQVTEFYWRYHFDQKSKEDGKQIKPITYSLKQQLLIAEVQAALLEYVTGFGLFIETLPSINVLLSPFKRYDEHVILRFMPPKEAGWPGPKLHVSVNSDNPGVIESNAAAELEYLAAGLRKAKDEKGEHLYNEETIDAWLKRIIQNGWDQAVDNVAGNL